MIAALFVRTNGVYFNDPRIDPYDQLRDARTYRGPYPVIAHPPCKHWGKLKHFASGEEGGLFEVALSAVRTYGGVIEHPAWSRAWRVYNLPIPTPLQGWTKTDTFNGRSAYVCQNNYGHLAPKETWVYAINCEPIEYDQEIRGARRLLESLSKWQREDTPKEFKEWLIDLTTSSFPRSITQQGTS